jgi:hypothetical protein
MTKILALAPVTVNEIQSVTATWTPTGWNLAATYNILDSDGNFVAARSNIELTTDVDAAIQQVIDLINAAENLTPVEQSDLDAITSINTTDEANSTATTSTSSTASTGS